METRHVSEGTIATNDDDEHQAYAVACQLAEIRTPLPIGLQSGCHFDVNDFVASDRGKFTRNLIDI